MTSGQSSRKTTTEIEIPYPEASDRHLRISVGACRLRIRPGAEENLVSGTYTDPTGMLPVKISQDGGTARLTQETNLSDLSGLVVGTPTFDLQLGKAQPYMLTLETGASDSKMDLGGLSISRLVIKQGAGKNEIDFSAPNPQVMNLLDLSAGAVSIELEHLANANCAEMRIEGGAAAYEFDFGGTLQRDTHVKITTGLASVEVQIPAATAAKIRSESAPGSLNVGDGFTKKEGAFWNEAALAGRPPVLTIHANVTLGALKIETD